MSTISEKLQVSKNGLDSLLAYANGKTGVSDVNIGDAIKTLCDGYGQGGEGYFKIKETTIASNVTNVVELANEIIPKDEKIDNHYYVFWNKTKSSLLNNYIISGTIFWKNSLTVLTGAGIRYRNGLHSSIQFTNAYDASVTIGDIYYYIDIGIIS